MFDRVRAAVPALDLADMTHCSGEEGAVDGVNLSVFRSEILCLLGPSPAMAPAYRRKCAASARCFRITLCFLI